MSCGLALLGSGRLQSRLLLAGLHRDGVGFFMVVNRQITVCSGSCTQWEWTCRLHADGSSFWNIVSDRDSYFYFDDLDKVECSFMSIFHCFLWHRFDRLLQDCPQSSLPILKYNRPDCNSLSLLVICSVSISFFKARAVLYFFCSSVESVFCPIKVAVCAINELETSSIFDNPSAAALVSKSSELCRSNSSPITSLRRWSILNC